MSEIKKNILIIGGEGFIGRNISEVLSKKFNCYSVGIVKSIFSKRNDIFIKKNPYIDKINKKFDIYIHLIDNQVPESQFKKGEFNLINNVKIKKNSHLIIFSSSVIYANPNSEYGKRKLTLEKLYQDYCLKNNINLSIVRLFNTYGKYQIPYKQGSLVANIFYNYLNKIPIEINDMQATRDLLYASDIGKFIIYIINHKYYSTIDMASEENISIQKLISLIQEHIIKDNLVINNKQITENILCPNANNQIINKIELSSLTLGLTKTFSFYKKNKDIIKQYLIK